MPLWNPIGWQNTVSPNRVEEFVTWERDTLQPKYGINFDIEYTHTLGVAELYDYEWYFGGFYRTIRDKSMADRLGVEVGSNVVYFPRRAYDMWNTRYFVLPYHPNGWRDEARGYAAFLFQSERVDPKPEHFKEKPAPLRSRNGSKTMTSRSSATCKSTLARGLSTKPGQPAPSSDCREKTAMRPYKRFFLPMIRFGTTRTGTHSIRGELPG